MSKAEKRGEILPLESLRCFGYIVIKSKRESFIESSLPSCCCLHTYVVGCDSQKVSHVPYGNEVVSLPLPSPLLSLSARLGGTVLLQVSIRRRRTTPRTPSYLYIFTVAASLAITAHDSMAPGEIMPSERCSRQ